MLEQIGHVDDLKPPQGTYRCRVLIPEAARRILEKKGATPTLEGDGRRFPRHRTRGWAVLEYQSTFAALQRPAESHAVLLVDLSRGGVGFLHSEQLFPLEQMCLTLHNNRSRTITIMHCRRLGDCCYLIGGEFTKTL
jgi:hypothetical protein